MLKKRDSEMDHVFFIFFQMLFGLTSRFGILKKEKGDASCQLILYRRAFFSIS